MAQNVVINGVTYSDVPEVDIPKSGGGTATFYDPSDATATQAHVLAGDTAYISGGKKTGTMPNNGDTSGDISTKEGTVSIPEGYTSGGAVGISSTEKAKIVSGNLRHGVTLLGVSGADAVVDTTIASNAADASKILNGYKAYVAGSLLTGTATVPNVSQNSQTKVLTIS